jgi:hypothetical protein
MDPKNPLHTAGTYRLARAEQIALMFVLLGAMAWNWQQLNLLRAAISFFTMDIVGYIPGAIAYRKSKTGEIPPIYHYMYNLAHTHLVVGAVIAIWAWVIGGFEWAMLAGPLHLTIDRGVFGNIFKPVALPFEPVAKPERWAAIVNERDGTADRVQV